MPDIVQTDFEDYCRVMARGTRRQRAGDTAWYRGFTTNTVFTFHDYGRMTEELAAAMKAAWDRRKKTKGD